MNTYYSNWGLECDEYDCIYQYVGLDGKPVKRNKEDYPYSYDPYIVWRNNYNPRKSNAVYSDRLIQWDYYKYNKCCKEIWDNESQYFSDRDSKSIEKFLSLYLNKKIKLTVIMEGCNVSNGYPYWVFIYEDVE